MRRPFRMLRLSLAALVVAIGLSILGVGVALASPAKSHRPVVKIERHSKHENSSAKERSDHVRDR